MRNPPNERTNGIYLAATATAAAPPGINAAVTLTPKGGLQFRLRELS